MKLIDGIPVWGDPVDEGAFQQIKNSSRGAARSAMMADHHLGYTVPIGGVLAYDYAISPAGVGFDIACGNKAVKTSLKLPWAAKSSDAQQFWLERVMDRIYREISFGMGRVNAEPVDHDLFDDPAWQDLRWLTTETNRRGQTMRDKAAAQLGTVGSGNHYVDLFEDEEGWVWVGVHFGSRGLGHGIATHYLEAGGAKNSDIEPLVLSTESTLGQEYLQGMGLAGRYAYAGRDWVCNKVADIIGARITEEVHNHHNFAWLEQHDGRSMWVVRKGATPAFPGQRGFIGGSMGEDAVIVEGRYLGPPHFEETDGQLEQRWSLFSTVHGAGRAMSRTAARGKFNRKGKLLKPGAISKEMMLDAIGDVVLRGAGTDEAPQAYKRLPDVLSHHAATIRVLHTLRPLGVAMASPDVWDPYKD
jgi:tRNA-splicing ligase RtcB (3'-phosphate/5'-hydroxy nucleic acid ligase)